VFRSSRLKLNSAVFARYLNCTMLLLFTGAVTIWLRVVIEPCLTPGGQWQAPLTFLFVFVLWPALSWSLRSMARIDLTNPYSMLWWW
jgi:hypothetical protein